MINKQHYESLLRRLDAVQKEINDIHNELLIELEMSDSERSEIEAIQKENDYRTFEEWEKEEPLD